MKMLVVIDYQKDFVDGSLGFKGAEKLDSGIAALIREYRDNGDIILVSKDTHGKGLPYGESREGKALPVPHCIHGSEGWELYGETGEVVSQLSDYKNLAIMEKESFAATEAGVIAALTKTELDTGMLLSDANACGIEEIRFVGLVSNICVISNMCVLQGMFTESQIVLDASLTDSFDKRKHLAVLAVAEGLQVRVENKPEIALRWGSGNSYSTFFYKDILEAAAASGKILANGGHDVKMYLANMKKAPDEVFVEENLIHYTLPGQEMV